MKQKINWRSEYNTLFKQWEKTNKLLMKERDKKRAAIKIVHTWVINSEFKDKGVTFMKNFNRLIKLLQ